MSAPSSLGVCTPANVKGYSRGHSDDLMSVPHTPYKLKWEGRVLLLKQGGLSELIAVPPKDGNRQGGKLT